MKEFDDLFKTYVNSQNKILSEFMETVKNWEDIAKLDNVFVSFDDFFDKMRIFFKNLVYRSQLEISFGNCELNTSLYYAFVRPKAAFVLWACMNGYNDVMDDFIFMYPDFYREVESEIDFRTFWNSKFQPLYKEFICETIDNVSYQLCYLFSNESDFRLSLIHI